MIKKKEKECGIILNIRVSEELFQSITTHQLEMTRQEKKIISRSDMVRRALELCYPCKHNQISFIK